MYETIDNYFEGRLPEAEKAAFEAQLGQDPVLADEVAFYLSTKVALRDAALQKRHTEWTQKRTVRPLRWQWASGIAAAVILLAVVWYYIQSPLPTLQQQADVYITQHWSQLPGQMDVAADSLQSAVGYYNKHRFDRALPIFQQLSRTNPLARTYVGFTQLQLKNYDAAITVFEQMASDSELLDTHGKFYAALAYLQKGDTDTARRLLEEVTAQNLGGKEEAEKWLRSAP